MDKNSVDLGEMKSRDIGNLLSKPLVDIGKDIVAGSESNENIDYGNLPSRSLAEPGKQAVANYVGKQSTE